MTEGIVNTLSVAPVRISIPASIAADLGALQKSMAAFAERLGHPECYSGVDCGFLIEQDYIITETLEAQSVPRTANIFREVAQEGSGNRYIRATLPRSAMYDIGKMQEVVANIAERLSCPKCCSGFDILFRQERDFLIDENLNIRATFGNR